MKISLFRNIRLLALLLVLSPACRASAADWAASFGGIIGANAYTQATTTDAAGNTYLAGYFDGNTLTLGSVTLTRIGTQDAFVAKLDPLGTVLWAKNFGGSGASVIGYGVAVDVSGNVYLGGVTTANLTTPALTKIGAMDAFAIKLDSSGTLTWAKNFGGSGANASGLGIAVDGSGAVYLGGHCNGIMTTPALPWIGDQDAFVVKLDSSGAVTWAKNFGGSGASAYGNGIATDGSGAVYLGGYFQNANLTTPALTKIGVRDAYAIKLDSSGTVTWAKNFGGSGASAYGKGIVVDGSANVFLGGDFDTNLTAPTLSKIGTQDAFAIKLDSSGAVTWAKNFGGSGATVNGNGIAADGSGNVSLGGYFYAANLTAPALTKIGTADVFAIKLNASGVVTWAQNFGGSVATAVSYGIAVDGSGNVYLGGLTDANLTTPALTKIGIHDVFAIKLDPTGATTWAKNFGSLSGSGYTVTYATTKDELGNIYLSGYFTSPIFKLGNVTLTRIGTQDAFVAKLDAAGTVTWAKSFGGSGASASGYSTVVDGSGNVYLGGYFQNANLTAPALTRIGGQDAFAIKLDASGAITWAKNFGGSGASAYGQSIATDGSGNVYLGGYFQYANLTTPVLTKMGIYDAFTLKLDSTGATIWAKNFGGSGANAYGYSIAVDGSGNVYLGGDFLNSNLTTPALMKIGARDTFAIKLDSTGATTWAKNFGGSGAGSSGQGIAVDGFGNAYLAGYFFNGSLTTPALTRIGSQDAFALKLDSSGAITWARNFGGSGAGASGNGIAVDGSGSVYLGGYYYSANLTTPALTKIGSQDAFALKLDSTGATTWAKNFGGSGATAYGLGIAVDGSGNVSLGGYFAGANLTTPALTKNGINDAFIIYTQFYTLTFTAGPNGSISGASPQTVDSGGSGSAVTGVPSTGYHFVNWTGTNGFVTTTSNPLTVTNVATDMTITANFAINQYTVTATATGNGTGSISSSTGGISYSYQTSNTGTTSAINYGTAVILTTNAGAGSTASWTTCDGTASGNGTTAATCTYSSLNGNKSAQATFMLNQHTLTVSKTGTGSGTVAGGGTYNYGSSNQLTATAATGSTFTGWSGDCTGSASPVSVTMLDRDMTCTATFADTSPPVFTLTSPASDSYRNTAIVGYTLSEAAASGTVTFTQTGGTSDPDSPQVYTMVSDDMTAGSHSVNTGKTLVNGAVYTIRFNATDIAGNAATPVESTNVTYDTVAATVTLSAPAGGSRVNNTLVSYSLSKAIQSGQFIFTQTGGATDSNSPHTYVLSGIDLNSGSHTGVATDFTLVDGAVYTVSMENVVDLMGNASTPAPNTNITFDSTAVAITGTAPVASSFVRTAQVSYTLSEQAASGSVTFTRTDTPASPQSFALTGDNLTAGVHANIDTLLALVDGAVYTVSFNAVDLAGNPATTVSNASVACDTTAPTLSRVSIASSNADPTKAEVGNMVTVSFTSSEPIATPTVTVNGNAASVTGGTTDWSATYTVQAGDALGQLTFSISAFNDRAGNSGMTVMTTTDASSVTRIMANQTLGTITFTPPTLVVGGTTTASAGGGASGNPVTFTSQTPTVCTTSGTNGATVTGVSAGTCTIAADQAGNAIYAAAPQVTKSFAVTSGTANLTVSILGTGGGSVSSTTPDPVGAINCANGSSTGCSYVFTNGASVMLYATPDWKSSFTGWGLPCGGSGSCLISLNGDSGVLATFTAVSRVKISGPTPTLYASLQDAYDHAIDGDALMILVYTFTENLNLDKAITVYFSGGMASDYLGVTDYTTLKGSLTIDQGMAVIDRLIIE